MLDGVNTVERRLYSQAKKKKNWPLDHIRILDFGLELACN